MEQPFIVFENPRPIDLVLVNKDTLTGIVKNGSNLSGVILDMDSLAPLDNEAIDGLMVALMSIIGKEKSLISLNGLGSISGAHSRAQKHGFDSAVARIHDNSGITEAASLPIIWKKYQREFSHKFSNCRSICRLPM